jgi:hypothetical protein
VFQAVSAKLTASAASSCQLAAAWPERQSQHHQPGRAESPFQTDQQEQEESQNRQPERPEQEELQPDQCLRIPASRRPSASARQQLR